MRIHNYLKEDDTINYKEHINALPSGDGKFPRVIIRKD